MRFIALRSVSRGKTGLLSDDPNAKRLSPFNRAEILWKFTKRGEFEYACLIPGHLEAGMLGKVIVK